MEIRELVNEEFTPLLQLYTQLHDSQMPQIDDELFELWMEIQEDANHHIIGAIENGKLISSCVLLIVPNLTHNQRPYALIENMVTHKDHRFQGYGKRVLNYAKKMAQSHNCYKIMLMTSAKDEETLQFYETAGYNRKDKTAFVQWL